MGTDPHAGGPLTLTQPHPPRTAYTPEVAKREECRQHTLLLRKGLDGQVRGGVARARRVVLAGVQVVGWGQGGKGGGEEIEEEGE